MFNLVMKKRGVSPVIATILLVAIVIILAVIIFLWARGFIAEELIKNDRAVDTWCDNVEFRFGIAAADCGSGLYKLDFVNDGQIPIYGFVVKEISTGNVVIQDPVEDGTITVGQTHSTECRNLESGNDLMAIPMILGETESGKQSHTCSDIYGVGAQVPN